MGPFLSYVLWITEHFLKFLCINIPNINSSTMKLTSQVFKIVFFFLPSIFNIKSSWSGQIVFWGKKKTFFLSILVFISIQISSLFLCFKLWSRFQILFIKMYLEPEVLFPDTFVWLIIGWICRKIKYDFKVF